MSYPDVKSGLSFVRRKLLNETKTSFTDVLVIIKVDVMLVNALGGSRTH